LGADSDVSITIDGKTYYLQVKTLYTDPRDDVYSLVYKKYPDKMLMVMVNNERTRFALEFAGNIKGKLSLCYKAKKSKYSHIMYTDIEKFKSKLKELIVLSCTKMTFASKSNEKEYLSF
jgi:hypothetical protein